ncbi:porin [uncultured Hymenobacter sp.]|uniref:porin n=1 Tax=uncultured Hymenobacter sp. TaxID=170016 RepID=UPI0035CA1474
MKNLLTQGLTLGLALAATGAALAQVAPTTDPALAVPAPAAPIQATPGPLTFYGYVDGYYGFDFKHDNGNDRPGFLYSHDRQNEFTVNQGLIGARYDDGKVRGAFGLHAGSYVTANYAAEDQVFKHIYEAYAGFRPFQKAWLDVGIFGSHIGFESAISKDNWTLTRSVMADNSPYYQAGAKLSYEVGPTLTLTGLVLNGWQNIRETNQAKALGTQIQWKPSDKLLINSSGFYGQEQPAALTHRRRYFHDFYVSYAATDRLSLALVFDVGKQENERRGAKADTWHTGAAFVKYKLADRLSTTLRGEYYKADRGVIINSISPEAGNANFRVAGGSLNLDYAPAPNVLFRVEGRYLNGINGVFQRRDGSNAGTGGYGNLTSSVAISF